MTNGVNPPGRDPDDWFTEPAPRRTAREAGTPLAVETARPTPPKDWLADDVEEHGRSWRDRISVAMREWRALILLLGGALVLVIGLLVAGVFSGSRTHPSSASVASTTTTRTRPQTIRPVNAPTTTLPQVPGPTTSLKPGDTGPEVLTLQKALKSLRYDVGTPDGVYGGATQSAVARFQSHSHLIADGVFGPATLAALTTALAGP